MARIKRCRLQGSQQLYAFELLSFYHSLFDIFHTQNGVRVYVCAPRIDWPLLICMEWKVTVLLRKKRQWYKCVCVIGIFVFHRFLNINIDDQFSLTHASNRTLFRFFYKHLHQLYIRASMNCLSVDSGWKENAVANEYMETHTHNC